MMDKPSPLKIFVQAKKEIALIFADLSGHVDEIHELFNEVSNLNSDIIDDKLIQNLQDYKNKIHGIHEILLRNHMKVAFFGRTSNGKSTVINSMLGERVLPSGIGHTTNCFVQVEGIGDSTNNKNLEPYTYVEGELSDSKNSGVQARKSITNVEQLANALTSDKLSHDSLVHICWPKNRCPLLRDDVILVDSPGIDVSPDTDQWIDKHCQDADVFILVANAESTLMQTEKNFFHKVATQLSAPNIFVLNNRWDASSPFDASIVERVKKQHNERVVKFLTDELGVMTVPETIDRVFFISAKEALEKRLAMATYTSPMGEAKTKRRDNAMLGEDTSLVGADARWNEFQRFESKFEECISRSALKTKFEKHTNQAISMCQSISRTLEAQIHQLGIEREKLVAKNAKTAQKIRGIENGVNNQTAHFQKRIETLSEVVKKQVKLALDTEIRRLDNLVDEFDWNGNHASRSAAFTDPIRNKEALGRYKRDLEAFVEDGLSRNLSSRCLADTLDYLQRFKRDLTTSFGELLALSPDPEQPDSLAGGKTNNSHSLNLALKNMFNDPVMTMATTSSTSAIMDDPSVISPDTSAMLKTAFHLDCRDLWRDFHEHLEFRFSLSPARLIKRILIPLIDGSRGIQNRPPHRASKNTKTSKHHSKSSSKSSNNKYLSGDEYTAPQHPRVLNKKLHMPASDSYNKSVAAGDNTPVISNRMFSKEIVDHMDNASTRPAQRLSLPELNNFDESGGKNSRNSRDYDVDSESGESLDAMETKRRTTLSTTTYPEDEDEEASALEELRNLSLVMTGSLFGMSSAGTGLLGIFILWKILASVLTFGGGSGQGSPIVVKLLSISGLAYAGLYCYERATYTTKSKEKLFKRQFVSHGTHRLRLIASRAAIHCASHVTGDAQRSLVRFTSLAGQYKKSLEVAARSDNSKRENCDRLIADLFPRVEGANQRIATALEMFLRTYFRP